MVRMSRFFLTHLGKYTETLFGLHRDNASCYVSPPELPLGIGRETQQAGSGIPVVGVFGLSSRSSKHSVMKPILICRTDRERCLIEPSINSLRISIKIKQADEMETVLCRNFSRFLMQRAESFAILRRKPMEVSYASLCFTVGLRH